MPAPGDACDIGCPYGAEMPQSLNDGAGEAARSDQVFWRGVTQINDPLAKHDTAGGTIGQVAKARGVKRVCIPNRSTKSAERKREQKKRWFRNGQKWRTGCEGRISVVKRRHGLDRCRYKGSIGMKRWVGLGVVADNLINIGRAMENQSRQP